MKIHLRYDDPQKSNHTLGYSRQTPAQGAAPKVGPPVYPVTTKYNRPDWSQTNCSQNKYYSHPKENIANSQITTNARQSIMTNKNHRPGPRRGPPRHHPLSGSSRPRHRLGNHHWLKAPRERVNFSTKQDITIHSNRQTTVTHISRRNSNSLKTQLNTQSINTFTTYRK